ncbi:STAS domain-containing protein [Pseudonocardia pini]|uniref:STAS domain-containing protein n=1 Tax=Pseudonocardia pini TaxID=2758030 RepID=UPI0015F0DB52|nr:STAS domain-containing protein [Pseudonocardia pini]
MTIGVLNLTWTRPEPDVVAVAVVGDLDLATADRLLGEVTEAATEPGLARVVLRCAELDFCDSHGLAVLLMIQRRLTAAGIGLSLDDRRPRLDRLLTITGTAALLTGETPRAQSQS